MTPIKPALPFSLTAPYYDLIYEKRKIQTTVRKILHHAKTQLQRENLSICDIGCGTGAYTLELYKSGAQVTGIDRSAEMLSVARKKAKEASADISFVVGDILSYKTRKKYDAVVSLFDVLSYMKTNREVESFFRSAASLLTSEGVFIFDCWYGPGVLMAKPKTMRQHYKNGEIEVFRKKTPKLSHSTNTVDVYHELLVRRPVGRTIEIRETHTMRYFFYPELESFAAKAGLRIVHWGELSYTMRAPVAPPWSVWIVARKFA